MGPKESVAWSDFSSKDSMLRSSFDLDMVAFAVDWILGSLFIHDGPSSLAWV